MKNIKSFTAVLVTTVAFLAKNAQAGLLYEPDSYVSQDNIVVNLDGIRNAGLLKAHDSNAEEWKSAGKVRLAWHALPDAFMLIVR